MLTIDELIIKDKNQVALTNIHLDEKCRLEIDQLIKEHKYISELHKYGLPVNNKVLLHGHSGCGKTITAKAISNRLDKNILILNLSSVISSRIGETSQNIKVIFDKARKENAVLFIDEFDHIAKARTADSKDAGEMRRLVNSMIQLIDYFPDNALLLCATNHIEILDPALVRRFQLKLKFELPTTDVLDEYYTCLLQPFPESMHNISRRYEISFAEARDHIYTKIKAALIADMEGQTRCKSVFNEISNS